MRKILAILLLVTSLLLALTACGGDKTPATENPGNSDSSVVSDEPSSDAPSDTVDPNAAITEEMVRSHAVAPAEDFSYDVADDGVTIRSYKGSDTIVVIPEKIEGKPVVGFKQYVFGNDSAVRGVLIPNTVETLSQVFIKNEVLEVVICEGVTKFAGPAFGYCTALRQVILGKNVQELAGVGTFGNCTQLKELHFTEKLTKIDGEGTTFGNCDNLTIYAPAGSYAETFANENNIPFKAE